MEHSQLTNLAFAVLRALLLLSISLISLSEAQSAVQCWIMLERSVSIGAMLFFALAAQLGTALTGAIAMQTTSFQRGMGPADVLVDVYFGITAVLELGECKHRQEKRFA